ncbi:unnamed protein product, partial [Rhizoctonia solani]
MKMRENPPFSEVYMAHYPLPAQGTLTPYCALPQITIDYESSPRDHSDWANKPEFTLIAASKDRDTIWDTLMRVGFNAEDIRCLSDEEASNSNINYELNRICRASGPTTIYIQGHGLALPNERIEFLPHDYYMNAPFHGIRCYDLQSALSPRQGRPAAQRLIITDFCQAYNFNCLPYVLKFDHNETPYWDVSDEWRDPGYEPSFSDTVVHFAAGSRGEITYENKSGGIFTQ